MSNQSKPLISVILPVWNPGPGISRCIESLRNQTLKDIEIIFVDDCGTDDSMDKVRAAAAEDSRIRILENASNIGPGPSRNKGIENARGEYLSFMDPDDYIELDFFELLYAETRKQASDIVKGSLFREKKEFSTVNYEEKTNQIILRKLSMGIPLFHAFINEHTSAIYRHELICSKNVRYGTSQRGEDSTFLLQVCFHANSFSIADAAYYHYCARSDAIIHTADEKTLQGIRQCIREQVGFVLRNLSGNKVAQKHIESRFLYSLKEIERFCDNPDFEKALSDTVKSLRSEWLRLPFHNDSAKNSFSLYALQEHCYLLPPQPFFFYAWESANPPVRYAKLVERWVDYYLNNPKEADACQKDLSRIIFRAKMAVKGKPYTTYSIEEQRQGKKLLYIQLARLPILLRIRICLVSTKSCLVHMLPNKIIQHIKRLRG